MNASFTTPSSEYGGSAVSKTVVDGTVVGLAVICVVLRFYTRIFTRVGLGWDDWLILAALITTLAAGALLLKCSSVDPDVESSESTTEFQGNSPSPQLYLELLLIVSVLYFALVSTTKLSILFLYKRLFSAKKGIFSYQVLILCVLVLGYWISSTVAALLNCRPIQRSWMYNGSDPSFCFNFNIFWMATGAVEVLLDVMILALPIQVTVSLKLSMRKKWLVSGIFLLGAFVVITGLLKTVLGYKPGGSSLSFSKIEVWTSIHTGMAIICSCLPIFGPLVARITHSRAANRVANSAIVSKMAKSPLRRHRSPLSDYDTLGDVKSVNIRKVDDEAAPVRTQIIEPDSSWLADACDLIHDKDGDRPTIEKRSTQVNSQTA